MEVRSTLLGIKNIVYVHVFYITILYLLLCGMVLLSFGNLQLLHLKSVELRGTQLKSGYRSINKQQLVPSLYQTLVFIQSLLLSCRLLGLTCALERR